MELSGKVAIVTGGDSGIGKAISELFAAEGASVVIADISDGGTADSISKKGGRAMHVKTDVRDEKQVKRLVAQTKRRFGGIDILCNNAGIELLKPMTRTTEEEWDRIMQTNLKGVFLTSKHVIPEMLERGGGAIVNTASQLGLVGLENFTAYCAVEGRGGTTHQVHGHRVRASEYQGQLHLSRSRPDAHAGEGASDGAGP